MSNQTACVFCGGMVAADADICPHCGGPVKQAVGKVKAPAAKQAAPTGSQCPACGARVGSGDIVCTQCGTNLLTGKKAVVDSGAAKGASSNAALVLKISGLVVVGILVVAALVVGVIYLLRDPVGDARRLARAGNLAQASETLQLHLERAPHDLEAQFLLGQIYWHGQQYARAAETFESVARQAGPRDRESALLAVLATERVSETGDRQRLAALLDSLTRQRYPNDSDLLKVLALLRGLSGEYRGQREAIEEAALLDNTTSPVLPGLARALDNDLEGAESSLRRALEQHPDDAAVPVALGFVRMLRDQPESAIEALEIAAAADTIATSLVKMQLGLLHMRQGSTGKALPLLTAAKNERPNDDRAVFLHALCLQENKLLDEALVAFEQLSGGAGSYAGMASLQMAVLYLEQGTLDRAAAMARRAGEAGLNTARQATIQGRIFALQGEMSQAEQAYRRAISMTSDYPAARLELGLLLINRAALDAGLEELEQYLALAQRDPARYRANEIEVLVTQIKQTRQ